MSFLDWLGIGIAFGVALVTTPLVRAAARRTGMVAKPRADRWHKKPTAMFGGVGIFAGVLAGSLFVHLEWPEGVWLIAGGVFVFLLGLADDIWRIRPLQKFLGQIAAALLLLLAGSKLPWSGLIAVDYALSFVWIIGITNAINLLDNMDGLAAGVALVAASFCALLLRQIGQSDWTILAGSLTASLAGFLIYNSNPASIFMGDSGALFIGYTLSALSIRVSAHLDSDEFAVPILVPVLVLLVPIFDTTFVTILRKLAGRPVSQGGRDHTSHRLVALGWSERAAVWILYTLALGTGAIAILATNSSSDAAWSAAYLCGCIVIFLGIHLAAVVTYPEAEFQNARQKKVWIACWWHAVDLRLLERILDACAILLVWRWDSRLLIDTAFAKEHTFLLGTAMLLSKCLCFFGLGAYRYSWHRLSAAAFTRLVQALALAELSCLPFYALAFPTLSQAILFSLFDFCLVLGICTAIRFAFQLVGLLVQLKKTRDLDAR